MDSPSLCCGLRSSWRKLLQEEARTMPDSLHLFPFSACWPVCENCFSIYPIECSSYLKQERKSGSCNSTTTRSRTIWGHFKSQCAAVLTRAPSDSGYLWLWMGAHWCSVEDVPVSPAGRICKNRSLNNQLRSLFQPMVGWLPLPPNFHFLYFPLKIPLKKEMSHGGCFRSYFSLAYSK